MADILTKASLKNALTVVVVAMIFMYLVANHTSAETAGKLGLTYQGA